MKSSSSKLKVALGVMMILCAAGSAMAQATANSNYRGLRSDYLRDWHIYGETKNDGVLNNSDTHLDTAGNWFTSEGSEDQANSGLVSGGHTYQEGKYAHNVQTFGVTDPKKNYWINQDRPNRMSFYMTYSQWDNNSTQRINNQFGVDEANLYKEQVRDRNGWALGWAAGGIPANKSDATKAGNMNMNIYVHDGKYTGINSNYAGNDNYQISNPKVVSSNGIVAASEDPNNARNPKPRFTLNYDETTHSYSAAANAMREHWHGVVHGVPLNRQEIDNSMKVREHDPYAQNWGAIADGTGRSAAELAQNGYYYQDAFSDDTNWYKNASTGGVIAGLSGQDTQVIRIDLGNFNAPGNTGMAEITEIVFYDFSNGQPGANDTPELVVFGVNKLRGFTEGQIWFDKNQNGQWDTGEVWFKENRFYIGNAVPEPATMAMLALGGIGLLRRRKNRK